MNPINFYSSICDCKNTEIQCPGTINSKKNGWVPRGFFTEDNTIGIDLMAVCKNPGHLLPNEAELYRDRPGIEIARIHLDFARCTFSGINDISIEACRSTTFHKNLLRYFAFFLDTPQDQVFKRSVYTNLVKCSTHCEQDRLKQQSMNECFTKHFLRELNYFKPKILIAFGREVENFLIKSKEKKLFDLPIIYVKHPSYFYRKDVEKINLNEIKNNIIKYI